MASELAGMSLVSMESGEGAEPSATPAGAESSTVGAITEYVAPGCSWHYRKHKTEQWALQLDFGQSELSETAFNKLVQEWRTSYRRSRIDLAYCGNGVITEFYSGRPPSRHSAWVNVKAKLSRRNLLAGNNNASNIKC